MRPRKGMLCDLQEFLSLLYNFSQGICPNYDEEIQMSNFSTLDHI